MMIVLGSTSEARELMCILYKKRKVVYESHRKKVDSSVHFYSIGEHFEKRGRTQRAETRKISG